MSNNKKNKKIIKTLCCLMFCGLIAMPITSFAKLKHLDESKVKTTETTKVEEKTEGKEAEQPKTEIGKKINAIASSFAKSQENAGIVYSDPQKPIVVKKSQPTFELILKSNQTTGYAWSLKNLDEYLIVPVKRIYVANENKGFAGGGGYEVWTFMAKPSSFVVPQTTSITLIYSRPWEIEGSQATHFKVVTINDN